VARARCQFANGQGAGHIAAASAWLEEAALEAAGALEACPAALGEGEQPGRIGIGGRHHAA